MATKKPEPETTDQAEPQPKPAETGDTNTEGEVAKHNCRDHLKLMVDKDGKPAPSLKTPLANHKCSHEGCPRKFWIS